MNVWTFLYYITIVIMVATTIPAIAFFPIGIPYLVVMYIVLEWIGKKSDEKEKEKQQQSQQQTRK